jgi:hypothetical protein
MKRFFCLIILICGILRPGSGILNAQASFGNSKLLNDNWLFMLKDEKEAF